MRFSVDSKRPNFRIKVMEVERGGNGVIEEFPTFAGFRMHADYVNLANRAS
jgi:hypothetical protein